MVTSTWETLREKLYVVTPTWEAEAKKSKLDRKDQSSLSPNQTRSTDYKESKKSYNESKKVPRVTRRVKNTIKMEVVPQRPQKRYVYWTDWIDWKASLRS